MSQLAPVVATAALTITGAALLAGALTLAVTRRPAAALGVLLDLLLAAGLLRLTGSPSWHALATAAAIVLLRRLVGIGLRAGGRALSPTPGPAGAPRSIAARVRGWAWSTAAEDLLRPAWRRSAPSGAAHRLPSRFTAAAPRRGRRDG